MGLLKWLCKRFSCNSNCKYNEQMAGCPKELADTISNIDNYKLSIKDTMIIGRILKKRTLKDCSSCDETDLIAEEFISRNLKSIII